MNYNDKKFTIWVIISSVVYLLIFIVVAAEMLPYIKLLNPFDMVFAAWGIFIGGALGYMVIIGFWIYQMYKGDKQNDSGVVSNI